MTTIRWYAWLPLPVLLLLPLCAANGAAPDREPLAFASPEEAEDFEFQGEYTGRLKVEEIERDFGVQIVAGGNRQFTVVRYPGGLPGEGWNRESPLRTDGSRSQSTLVLANAGEMVVHNDQVDVHDAQGALIGRLKKVHRSSRTLGLPPPPHAIVLFDGSNADAFEDGQVTADGLLIEGVMSHETFRDARLHLEFRTPFMPTARSQQRGNSGVYLQGRYEVQILDSFGLEGQDNECGGIYGVKPPDLNMALPPGSWQTYDIEFTAPRFDKQGQKVSDARMTVRHNGVRIHHDVSISGPTRASKVPEGPDPGPLYLQDHGNPVRFRNIWIVKRPAAAANSDGERSSAAP